MAGPQQTTVASWWRTIPRRFRGSSAARHRCPHPPDLRRVDVPVDARGFVHLGDQHAVPARRGAERHAGVRGERVLHRRRGAVRGPDRRGRRHPRTTGVLSPRVRDPARLDASVLRDVADARTVLGVGDRLDPPGAGVHLLLGRDRGLAVDGLKSTGYQGSLESAFAKGQIAMGIAMLGGTVAGGIVAQYTNLGVPYIL